MFEYVGKCSDGNFYWIIYYVGDGELTGIHIYRRALVNWSWRNERIVSGLNNVLRMVNTLPEPLRRKVREIINKFAKRKTVLKVDLDDVKFLRDYIESSLLAISSCRRCSRLVLDYMKKKWKFEDLYLEVDTAKAKVLGALT